MTPRQFEVLNFIDGHISTTGSSPSYREIAEHIGSRSMSRICVLMNSLKDDGYTRFEPKKKRNVRVTLMGQQHMRRYALTRATIEHRGECPTCGQALPQEEAAA